MSKEHKAVCVIAWPAGHSRSPLIHNYWINQHKLDAEYRREAVPPDKFAAFVGNLRSNGYIGANITVPHKESALALSEPDDRARAVGAANTLWCDDDTLRSTNTDVKVFLPISTWRRRDGTAVLRAPSCSAPAAARVQWCLRCCSARSAACM